MAMWQTLKEGRVSDEDLLEEVALASANEQERVEKSNLSKATPWSITINQLSTAETDSSYSSDTETLPVSKKKGTDRSNNSNRPNKKFYDGQNKRFEKIAAQISKLTTSTNTAIS